MGVRNFRLRVEEIRLIFPESRLRSKEYGEDSRLWNRLRTRKA